MLEVKNQDEFTKQIEAWCESVTKLTEDVGRGLSVAAFKYALEISPQHSGDFVANWRYSVGSVDNSWDNVFNKQVPETNKYKKRITGFHGDFAFQQGDWPARNVALNFNRGRDSLFKLGTTVYISNASAHDEPYAMKIELNQIRFRDRNPNGGAPIKQTIQAIGEIYSEVGRVKAIKLTREKL